MRVGPGVTPPHLLHKADPEFSPEARANHIQGTVVLQLVVNEKGRAVDISVISPLGFGLDEPAQAAVATWEFVPGMKGGVPVKILATVEVNFRFEGLRFDEKAEHQRTAYNVAVTTLNRRNPRPAAIDDAVRSILDLGRHKFGLRCLSPDYGRSTASTSPRTRQRALVGYRRRPTTATDPRYTRLPFAT